MRRDVRVDVSTDAKFTSDQVAVKATMRAAGAFPHPAAVQKITVGAA
jgi:HK97 family phage major capsid protein